MALIAAQAAFAWLPGVTGLWAGVGLWGLHMGLSQGGLAAAVAEIAPGTLRASAFGVFHFATGVFQLAGGALAGWLWTHHGSRSAFTFGAGCAVLGLLLLAVRRPAARG